MCVCFLCWAADLSRMYSCLSGGDHCRLIDGWMAGSLMVGVSRSFQIKLDHILGVQQLNFTLRSVSLGSLVVPLGIEDVP